MKYKIFNGSEINKELFLLEGLTYFCKNPSKNRCEVAGSCRYSKTSLSEGCFIGRHLDDDLCKKIDPYGIQVCGILSDSINPDVSFYNLIPKWINKENKDFLSSCQNLHDLCDNWVSDGLSKLGMRNLILIIEKFDIDIDKFKKFLN